MVNALTRHRDSESTNCWVGEVYEVSDTDFTGVLWNEYSLHGEEMGGIIVPFQNILETERLRIVRGALFFCDVHHYEDGHFDLLGIDFEDNLTEQIGLQPHKDLIKYMLKRFDRDWAKE